MEFGIGSYSDVATRPMNVGLPLNTGHRSSRRSIQLSASSGHSTREHFTLAIQPCAGHRARLQVASRPGSEACGCGKPWCRGTATRFSRSPYSPRRPGPDAHMLRLSTNMSSPNHRRWQPSDGQTRAASEYRPESNSAFASPVRKKNAPGSTGLKRRARWKHAMASCKSPAMQ